ncbi:hypothetical protein GDO81_023584, partial [Engystomops pustulosus]
VSFVSCLSILLFCARTTTFFLNTEKLSVDDIKIEPNVSSHDPCNVILKCMASGPNVTITWTSGDMKLNFSVVNVTDPEPQTRYTCTVQNPISTFSKSISPAEYCKSHTRNRGWIGLVIAFIVILVIIIGVGLYLWREHDK